MKSRRTRRADSPETSSGFSKFFGSLLTQGDMSRLGRDYLKVGQVMEVLRQRGVRLIAINDGEMCIRDSSYIGKKNQNYIAVAIDSQQSSPSQAQAKRMRELDEKKLLNGDVRCV